MADPAPAIQPPVARQLGGRDRRQRVRTLVRQPSLYEASRLDDPTTRDHGAGDTGTTSCWTCITTTRKHDTQIAPHVVSRNTDRVDILVGDKGYHDQALRARCRREGIRPAVRHRELTPLHKAWNARQEDGVCGQRAQSETVDSTIKRRFGSRVRSRVWYVQFREVTVKAIVHNIERAVARSHRIILQRFSTRPFCLNSQYAE